MQLLKKISRDTVFGSKDEVLELVMTDKDKSHRLYIVGGICNGQRIIAGKEGFKDSSALLGQFIAVNKHGEEFQSGVCFLPQFAADTVLGQLTEDNDAVEFKFMIGAHFDSSIATSYGYDVTPLIEPKPDDRLKALMADSTKLLEPPKKGK